MTSGMFGTKLLLAGEPASDRAEAKKMSFTSEQETASHCLVVVGIELVGEWVSEWEREREPQRVSLAN